MILSYFLALGFGLFAIGIAGALASRHIILIIISTEIILIAATLVGVGIFDFYGGAIIPILFAIWSVAAAGVMLLVLFYRYMTKYEADLDVTKLSKLRE